MKIPKLPVLVWAACLVGCFLSIRWLDATLPERVVRHFGPGGHADGWTTRSAHTVSFIVISLFFSSFVIGIVYVMRFLPPDVLNVPNAKYWRAPEHFREACEFLSLQAFWIGALSAVWCALFNYLVVRANRLSPPVLDVQLVGLVTTCYVAIVVAWLMLAVRHFYKKSSKDTN